MSLARPVSLVKENCIGKVDFKENEKVSLDTLSLLTGFPKDFIMKELALEDDFVPMKNLRKSMMKFLQSTIKNTDSL